MRVHILRESRSWDLEFAMFDVRFGIGDVRLAMFDLRFFGLWAGIVVCKGTKLIFCCHYGKSGWPYAQNHSSEK